MTVNIASSMGEGQSCNRPPLFNEENYTYWKACMHIFVHALDYDIWSIITSSPYYPTKTIDGISIPKLENEWNDQDKKVSIAQCKSYECAFNVSTNISKLFNFLMSQPNEQMSRPV